jgi:hypothetical protein
MIQVDNGHSEGILGSQFEQDIGKGNRIGTTGYRNQKRIAILKHAMGAKRLVNRSMDLFFNVGSLKTVFFCSHAGIIIRLRLITLQFAAGMIGLRQRLRPDLKARRTAPKLVRAKAG